jgi:hypothetical protein
MISISTHLAEQKKLKCLITPAFSQMIQFKPEPPIAALDEYTGSQVLPLGHWTF